MLNKYKNDIIFIVDPGIQSAFLKYLRGGTPSPVALEKLRIRDKATNLKRHYSETTPQKGPI